MKEPDGKPLSPEARTKLLRREMAAGERLPYERHVDDQTIRTRQGALVQVIYVAGFPFETADTQELNYRKDVRDTMLRGIANSRFAVYHHVIRRRAAPEAGGQFSNPFARALDKAWRDHLSEKRLFVNELFLTLVRRPLIARDGGLGTWFGKAAGPDLAGQARDLRELDNAREAIVAALQPYGARVLTAYDGEYGAFSELLEFLSCLYNGELRPVQTPRGDIGRYLPYRRVSFGLDALELSKAGALERIFAAMVSIKEYPQHTAPGILDAMMRLPHEFTVSESFAFVDRQVALDRMNLALRRMRAADDDALSLRRDLSIAKDNVAAGRSVFGEHHLTVMVKANSLTALDEAVADVQASFNEIGIIAVREDVAMEPAFWAQFPGDFSDIPRRSLISSANFAGLASCHNQPLGKAEGNHWGPAVTVMETTAASPYFFSFHRGDLGNFLIIGPSGSGKTVLLNFLIAQAQKFDPRVAFFDKDRGAEIFLRALGGRYDVLRPGQASGFNPLRLADTPVNRRFLQHWAARLLSVHGEMLTADDSAMIADAVGANYEQQPQYRRLRFFRELFAGARRPQAGDLAARLSPWCGDGDRAWLFDNEDDHIDVSARIIGFDMTQVLDDPVLRTPAMMYLFHRVEERMDGTPSITVIDEGWKALDDDVFVQRLRDWEKTIRKRGGIIGFATQSASDALDSRISSAVIEQTATQIFLPNPKAQISEYCDGFGLTSHEYDLVRSLPDTSRCFLIKHGRDSVVARLNLSGMSDLLTVLSGRERTVRRLDELRTALGDDPAAWMPALLQKAGGL
jgi:type IV secretion system protein VirB4